MNLLLLHGALGSKELFDQIDLDFETHSLSFSGHGKTPFKDEFSIEQFASEVIDYMDENELEKVSLFGHSMGGYVGLYLALNHPNRIEKVITLGTKLDWNTESVKTEQKKLNPTKIKEKVPHFAMYLEKMHGPEWEKLLDNMSLLLEDLGKSKALTHDDFKNITVPVSLCLGELDDMVTEKETEEVANLIPNCSFDLVLSFKHSLEHIDPLDLSALINDQL